MSSEGAVDPDQIKMCSLMVSRDNAVLVLRRSQNMRTAANRTFNAEINNRDRLLHGEQVFKKADTVSESSKAGWQRIS
jgi:hypothetical protein